MKCSFCKKEIRKASGKMFVKSDGSVFYFCSSKCHNNWKLKRDPKKVGWIRKKQTSKKKPKKYNTPPLKISPSQPMTADDA